MDAAQATTSNVSSKQHLWPRDRISNLVEQIRLDRFNGASLKQTAADNAVPRTTAGIESAGPIHCSFLRIATKNGFASGAVDR